MSGLSFEEVQGSRVLQGEWLCRTCGFKMSMRTIGPKFGVGVDATLGRHECPNDGALMDQATEADVIVALDCSVESWVKSFQEHGGRWWHITQDLPPVGDRVLVTLRHEDSVRVTFGKLHSFEDREGNPWARWICEDTVGAQVGHVTHWKRPPVAPDENMGEEGPGVTRVAGP